MVQIVNQKQAREVQKLSFCYLCGAPLGDLKSYDKDHLPPQGIFLRDDRNFPIILPVHMKCNDEWETSDERVKLLIDVLHGKNITMHSKKYKVAIAVTETGRKIPLISNVPLRAMIGRIIRGFHAALYGEFLPLDIKNKILTPIPEGRIIDGKVILGKVLPQFRPIAGILRASVLAKATDAIVSNNGKLRYECAWPQLDDGRRFCIFGLDIYNWKSLGNEVSDEDYACIGSYFLDGHMPAKATVATRIQVPSGFNVGLDRFD